MTLATLPSQVKEKTRRAQRQLKRLDKRSGPEPVLRVVSSLAVLWFSVASRQEALRYIGMEEHATRVARLGSAPRSYLNILRTFFAVHASLCLGGLFLICAAGVWRGFGPPALVATVFGCVLARWVIQWKSREPGLGRTPIVAVLFLAYNVAELFGVFQPLPYAAWTGCILLLLGSSFDPHCEPLTDATEALRWMLRHADTTERASKTVWQKFSDLFGDAYRPDSELSPVR